MRYTKIKKRGYNDFNFETDSMEFPVLVTVYFDPKSLLISFVETNLSEIIKALPVSSVTSTSEILSSESSFSITVLRQF